MVDSNKLEELLGDFRCDDGRRMAVDVDRWASQFASRERDALVAAVTRWVEHFYWSRSRVERSLAALAGQLNAEGFDLSRVALVDAQPKDSGQRVLNRLWASVVDGWSPPREGHTQLRVYLDDCTCTGRTLDRTFRPLLASSRPREHFLVHHIIQYRDDLGGRRSSLRRLANHRGATLRFQSSVELENRHDAIGPLDVLRPMRRSADRVLDSYRAHRRIGTNAFREPDLFGDAPLFGDAGERETVERALLRVGAFMSLYPRRGRTLRPLGFGDGTSLGFGAVAFTFHNAPNTMPPALWWRDPAFTEHWFPLVPRRVT